MLAQQSRRRQCVSDADQSFTDKASDLGCDLGVEVPISLSDPHFEDEAHRRPFPSIAAGGRPSRKSTSNRELRK
jgi:hypothetical protein